MSERELAALRASLGAQGLDEVELYLKQGRSHRVELAAHGQAAQRVEVRCEEAGWAVRASGRRGSLFSCGTGRPSAREPWPAARGEPIQLPTGRSTDAATPSGDEPLISESEAVERLERFGRLLTAEMPDARVVRAVLDDGASSAHLLSTRGVDCEHRQRTAALYLEVAAGETRRAVQLAARTAVEFDVEALARRLGTLLTVARDGGRATAGTGDMVLAPAVAARLLAGLLPALVGPEGGRLARGLCDRQGRIGSELLSVVDDGALAGGVFSAPRDGEGVPTREVVLIDSGHYRQPLLSWREAAPGTGESSGCSLRPSWRQGPEPGPTHLYIRPRSDVPPGTLVQGVSRGHYWLEPLAGGRFDLAGDRFELPVSGFELRSGQASEPVAGARMHGSISGLLGGIRGVARDLRFHPLGHLLGAPTLLIAGLQLDATA